MYATLETTSGHQLQQLSNGANGGNNNTLKSTTTNSGNNQAFSPNGVSLVNHSILDHAFATAQDMSNIHNGGTVSYAGLSAFPPSPSSDSHSESPTSHAQPSSHGQQSQQQPSFTHGHNRIHSGRRDSCLTPPHSATAKDHQVAVSQDLLDFEADFLIGPVKFNSEQIDCICDSLQQRGERKLLEEFLQTYESDSGDTVRSTSATTNSNSNSCGYSGSAASAEPSEAVMRAKAYNAYESGNFRELYEILESRNFDPKYHSSLQEMWYKAHYKEAAAIRGRDLGKSTADGVIH